MELPLGRQYRSESTKHLQSNWHVVTALLSQLLFLQLYHHGVSARHTLVFLTNQERFRVDTAKVLKNFVQAPRSWQVTLDQCLCRAL